MSRLKIGQRVKLNTNIGFAGVKKGDTGTIESFCNDNTLIMYTDKINTVNLHSKNGMYVFTDMVDPLTNSARWTRHELNYLHKWYHRKPIKEIAEKLNRSYYAVQSKARHEGIHNHPRREYNDRDNRFIRHTYMDNWKVKEIGRQLHRSESSIRSRIDLMNSRDLLPSIPKEVD